MLAGEVLARTLLQCDEASDFQRVVSARIAARHGTWSYSQEEQRWSVYCANCGRQCQPQGRRCGEPEITGPCNPHLRQRLTEQSRLGFADGGRLPLHTPACARWESESSQGCVYTHEAIALLNRRSEFLKTDGAVISRILRASEGLRGNTF